MFFLFILSFEDLNQGINILIYALTSQETKKQQQQKYPCYPHNKQIKAFFSLTTFDIYVMETYNH